MLLVFLTFLMPLLLILSCAATQAEEQANYQLHIKLTWSAETHPFEFPPSPTFSHMIGATHSDDYALFKDSDTGSSGLELIAERGRVSIFRIEFEEADDRELTGTVFEGDGIEIIPGEATLSFSATAELPLVSFVTMLAPSPDWVTGLSGVPLHNGAAWIDHLELPLWAWEDESAALVDAFCKRAEERGITVQRDKDVMRLGDSIATFMHRLAEGDRVVVVLSDKYLRSPFCMYELYHIWMQARYDKERLRKRIRVFTQKDAKVDSIPDRAAYAKYWDEECRSCVAATKDSFHLMDSEDQREISNMREFASQVAKILRVVKDTLQPKTLDELERYVFDGGAFDD